MQPQLTQLAKSGSSDLVSNPPFTDKVTKKENVIHKYNQKL